VAQGMVIQSVAQLVPTTLPAAGDPPVMLNDMAGVLTVSGHAVYCCTKSLALEIRHGVDFLALRFKFEFQIFKCQIFECQFFECQIFKCQIFDRHLFESQNFEFLCCRTFGKM
jgi:hypothetical protein